MEHTFLAAMAALLVTGTIIGGFFAIEKEFLEEKTAIEETEVPSPEEEPEKIVLGVFEGKLAIFAGKSPYPNMVYDFFIRDLPEEDRERLSEGIEVSSESELRSLLEDFMS